MGTALRESTVRVGRSVQTLRLQAAGARGYRIEHRSCGRVCGTYFAEDRAEAGGIFVALERRLRRGR